MTLMKERNKKRKLGIGPLSGINILLRITGFIQDFLIRPVL